MRGVVVVPTYNERENIVSLVEEILAQGAYWQVVIVDDNSPDGTGAIAEQLASRHPRVYVLHRPAKLGLGSAHIAGMRKALALGADVVVTMDADFSHHPSYLGGMVLALQKYDLVIGSRYVDGGGTSGCTVGRRLLSRGANLFARLALGLPVRDCTAGYRCYRRAVLESIELDSISAQGYSFLIEVLYRCHQQGWRIGEMPILFKNRERGRSKISRVEIAEALWTVLRLALGRLPFAQNSLRWTSRNAE